MVVPVVVPVVVVVPSVVTAPTYFSVVCVCESECEKRENLRK